MSDGRAYDLILTVVNHGFADVVVDAARTAGARGGTIMHGRGSGIDEIQKFLGITVAPEKDIVLTLVPREQRTAIIHAISREAGLSKAGHGIAFSLPVDEVTGLSAYVKSDEHS